ncbi:hypothetical protein AB0J86_21655 [Micromonospora sp. NPDC049559]|uniref:hypothetical protein n=1 Tax=Micromonospora sp. NPDC049559 TaxID=3155923 RepID=UPI00343BF1B6
MTDPTTPTGDDRSAAIGGPDDRKHNGFDLSTAFPAAPMSAPPADAEVSAAFPSAETSTGLPSSTTYRSSSVDDREDPGAETVSLPTGTDRIRDFSFLDLPDAGTRPGDSTGAETGSETSGAESSASGSGSSGSTGFAHSDFSDLFAAAAGGSTDSTGSSGSTGDDPEAGSGGDDETPPSGGARDDGARRRRRRLIGGAAAGTVLVLLFCGGIGTVAVALGHVANAAEQRREVRSRTQLACLELERRLNRLAPPGAAAGPAQRATAIRAENAATQPFLAEIEQLQDRVAGDGDDNGRPGEAGRGVAGWLDDWRRLIGARDAYADALDRQVRSGAPAFFVAPRDRQGRPVLEQLPHGPQSCAGAGRRLGAPDL